jgi:hypothetical protein
LEALQEFLKSPAVNIPVGGIGIGPVHKKDVMKASVMLEKKKEYATMHPGIWFQSYTRGPGTCRWIGSYVVNPGLGSTNKGLKYIDVFIYVPS